MKLTIFTILLGLCQTLMIANANAYDPDNSNEILCRESNETYFVDLTSARYEVINSRNRINGFDISYADQDGFDYDNNQGRDVYRMNLNGSSKNQIIVDFETNSSRGTAYTRRNGVKKKLSSNCKRQYRDRYDQGIEG